MSAGAIRAGKAVIELAVKNDMARGLNKAKAQLQKFGNTTRNIGAALFGGAAALALPFAGAIKSASDFEESLNRFNSVFKGNAAAARAFAEEYGDAVGRSDKQMLDSLATFQSFFVGLGKGADEAANLSKELAKASIDFASFNNLSDEEAMERFLSAMSGSSEVLRPFGVDISAAALKLRGITAASTEAEKAAARYAIIIETMTTQGSMGDAVATAGSFANQMKALGAEFENAKVALGSAVLPLISDMVKQVVPLVKMTSDWIAENKELVKGFFISVGVLGSVGAALVILGTALSSIAAVVGFIATPFGLFATVLAGIALSSEDVRQAAVDAGTALRDKFGAAFGDIQKAMESGDIGHAAKVGLAHVQLAFTEAFADIQKTWIGFKAEFIPEFDDMFKTIYFQIQSLRGMTATGTKFKGKGSLRKGTRDQLSPEQRAALDGDPFENQIAAIDAKVAAARKALDDLNKETDAKIAESEKNAPLVGTLYDVDAQGEDGGVAAGIRAAIEKIEGQIKGAAASILPGALEDGSLAAAQKAFENDEKQRFGKHMALLQANLDNQRKMLAALGGGQVIKVAAVP